MNTLFWSIKIASLRATSHFTSANYFTLSISANITIKATNLTPNKTSWERKRIHFVQNRFCQRWRKIPTDKSARQRKNLTANMEVSQQSTAKYTTVMLWSAMTIPPITCKRRFLSLRHLCKTFNTWCTISAISLKTLYSRCKIYCNKDHNILNAPMSHVQKLGLRIPSIACHFLFLRYLPSEEKKNSTWGNSRSLENSLERDH